MMMSCDDASAIHGGARIEVFTAKARRRVWPDEDKARIVAESYADGSGTVCDVARWNGICPSQLFTWRRQLRTPVALATAPLFVPAVVDEPPPVAVLADRTARTVHPARRRRRSPRGQGAAPIEVSMDGISVRIGRGADPALITAVLDALKGSR